MILETIPQIQALTGEQKFTLWKELCIELVMDADLNPGLAHEVQSSLDEYRANPQGVTPWSEVRRKILAREKIHA
jgi:hypothetical protein